MRTLRKSTATNTIVFMTDVSDHLSGKTGLTLTITASKNGSAFSSISPTVTERSNGFYQVALTTSHTDTFGELVLYITSSGADPTKLWYDVNAIAINVAGVPIVDIGYSLGSAVTNADGTAQGGSTSTTIVLDSLTPSVNDNNYSGRAITIVNGTGIGQSRKIVSYTNSSQTATVYPAWVTTPDSTSQYVIGDIVDSTPTIRKNIAFTGFPFSMVSSSDHISPATGATVTAERSIDGGSFASCSNSPAEVGNGYYKITLSASDVNGSIIALKFTATSCDPRIVYVFPVA